MIIALFSRAYCEPYIIGCNIVVTLRCAAISIQAIITTFAVCVPCPGGVLHYCSGDMFHLFRTPPPQTKTFRI